MPSPEMPHLMSNVFQFAVFDGQKCLCNHIGIAELNEMSVMSKSYPSQSLISRTVI